MTYSYSYTTTGVAGFFTLRRGGVDVGEVHLDPRHIHQRSVAMQAIVDALNTADLELTRIPIDHDAVRARAHTGYDHPSELRG